MYGEVNLNYSWLHMFSSESLSPSCLLSPSPECLCVCIFHLLFFFSFGFTIEMHLFGLKNCEKIFIHMKVTLAS